MNGGKETGVSLGRNKTAQFSLTECLSNYLTQWKRSQNITAKYLWNKMYNSAGTWHDAWAPHEALAVSDLVGVANRTADGRPEPEGGDVRAGRKVVTGHRGKTSAQSNKSETRCRVGVWQRGCLNPSQRKWAVGLVADGNTASQQWSITFHNQCQY